jgi:hypothetical protein
MSGRLTGIHFNSIAATFLVLILFTLAAPQFARAADTGCANDRSMRVCVVSAALTGDPLRDRPGDERRVIVSVTLKVANTTDFPIDLALVGGYGAWSLTPQNAQAIMSEQSIVSGLQVCSGPGKCEYTTLSPETSLLVQLQYRGAISTAGLPLIEVASTAAFTTSMRVVERGTPRLVSFALEGFTFGNAIPNGGR